MKEDILMAFPNIHKWGKSYPVELEPSDVQFHHGSHGVREAVNSFLLFPHFGQVY